MKDFITLWDYPWQQLEDFIIEARKLKFMQKQELPHLFLKNRTMALIFEKASTRTRVSFEVGIMQLGGNSLFLSSKDLQLGRGESIADTARVLSRYVNGIVIRTFAHENIEELANWATVPVINGLTDEHHPCQVLADLFTIEEHKGALKGLKLCYVGDGNNVANSLLEGAVRARMDISIAAPEGFWPQAKIVEKVKRQAARQGNKVIITTDPVAAIKGADVVYTDVWTSMGQEDEAQKRRDIFQSYQVDRQLCSHADENHIILHCLPAYRGEEITSQVLDGSHSVIFDQAENRLHVQKAIMKGLINNF